MLCLFTHALRLIGILLSGQGMWQFCEQASKCCVQFASTLLLEGIPQYDRVRMLRTEKEHFAVLVIASHSLDDGHPSLYGKRMCQVTFGNNLSIDVEITLPSLRLGHPLIMSMGMSTI